MLGAAGALACLMAGTAIGAYVNGRRQGRLALLRAQMDVLSGMRLMLAEERLRMADLLREGANRAPPGDAGALLQRRYALCAQFLDEQPLGGVAGAYLRALTQTPCPCERQEELAALDGLFRQLGSGTAAMREQAVAACLRRLKPIVEKAQESANTGGRLCLRLGMLLGLMAGIALW